MAPGERPESKVSWDTLDSERDPVQHTKEGVTIEGEVMHVFKIPGPGELAVWPQDQRSRRKHRKVLTGLDDVEYHYKQCPFNMNDQAYCYVNLAPRLPKRRSSRKTESPAISHTGSCSPIGVTDAGSLAQNLVRLFNGLWHEGINSKWRGNKNKLAWPPAIRHLPAPWPRFDDTDDTICTQFSYPCQKTGYMIRDSTKDVQRIKAARAAGFFPEVLTAEYSKDEEDAAFGGVRLGFPTQRRPRTHRREMLQESSYEFKTWINKYPDMIGPLVITAEDKDKVMRLLETWKDIFCERIKDMPATDLMYHRIPTYKNAVPKVTKPPLYTPEEVKYQKKMIPELVDANIIARVDSPWAARSRFPRKSNGDLRMVHAFIGLNNVTIKSNYTMKRIEPILQGMAQPWLNYKFRADGANGYWAIPVWPEHCYKLGFSSSEGQFCYKRMGQGCTGGAGTYARLKDIITAEVPAPDGEPSLSQCMPDEAYFEHYMDDDLGGAKTLDALIRFLHDHYFPRLKWARLTLNPKKCAFFIGKVQILGHQRDEKGLRPAEDKLGMFRDWPTPTTKEEVMRFVYMLPFFKWYIPGRADLTTIIKNSIIEEKVKIVIDGKSKTTKTFKELRWGGEQQSAFNQIKKSVLENACSGGQPNVQYHLATDASKTGLGGILFQLPDHPPGTIMSKDFLDSFKVVMFISFQLTPAQMNYHTTERETLAVVRCLNECRWLVKGNEFPVMLYTDHQALLKALRSEDATGRLARWQLMLSEYDLDIFHVPGKDLAVADGLSRLGGYPSSSPSPEETTMEAFAIDEVLMADNSEEETQENTNEEPSPLHPDGISQEQEMQWAEWLDDPWYSEVVEYKLLGFQDQGLMKKAFKKIISKRAKNFLLIDNEGIQSADGKRMPNELAFIERSGKLSRCLHETEVVDALRVVHNLHGHWSNDITFQRCIGKFYWPSRAKDVNYYCRTCPQCQMLGPLKPSQGLLPIVQLQPLDCLGLDYMGPFTPIARSGARFIIIAVCYFTRFLFANAVPESTSANTLAFVESDIVDKLGWPRAFYHDNGSHFKKHFADKLKERKVKQIHAPTTHPSSVGLAERYVQLILKCLRTVMQHNRANILDWDTFLPGIVQAINSRLIKVYGFSPAELLLGYQPRYVNGAENYEDILRTKSIDEAISKLQDEGMTVEEACFESRMSRLDEIRAEALERRFGVAKDLANDTDKGIPPPKVKDLVKLRRLDLDNQKSHKLEPRWEGPYEVEKVSARGKSVILKDLLSNKIKGHYHINDTQPYLERSRMQVPEDSWRSVAEINEGVRKDVRDYMRKSAKEKKEENHKKGMDSNEEEPPIDMYDEAWWKHSWPGPNLYGDESWNYWNHKGKVVDVDKLMRPETGHKQV